MTRPEILLPAPLLASAMEALDRAFIVHRLWESPDPEGLLRARGMAASTLAGPVGAELFDRLPGLEIVANFGVGYDNIDVGAAAARRIMVTNTPGVLDEEVADLALALLLATVRRLPQADAFVRAGRWPGGPFPLSSSLRGRRVGILGLGGIGKAIARRLHGFAVEIAYHGRTRQADVVYPWYPTVTALAEACDVLIAILPGGAQTHHIIDAGVLAALGPQGVLINVARGSVVDEEALVAALHDGTIMAAGLDVFANEPVVPEALMAMENVVLLPHLGSASEVTRAAMGQLVVDNLTHWFDTGRALTPVPETRFLLD